MGFIKKVFRAVVKPVKFILDPVIDLGTSIVKAVISPFTGAFNLPDTSINFDTTSQEIKAATVVDFNGANRAIPVLYGTKVETATIPVFVGTHGDDSADTSPQYLYMAAVISQGFHGANSEFNVNGAMGSLLSRMLLDGKPVHLGGISNTANPNYSQGYDGSTALNLTNSGGGIFASGKGGVQPAQHTITKGTFANRVKIQYFDGSSDQPASSLLREHPDWDDDNNTLSGIHYVALRFQLQAADVTIGSSPYSGDGEGVFPNPFSNAPAVVVTTSGRSLPNVVASKANDPGYEERFDTNYADNGITKYISFHQPLGNPSGANGTLTNVDTQDANEIHTEVVGSDTQIDLHRFSKYQEAKRFDGSTHAVNIHDILFGLGWTYDFVYLSFGNPFGTGGGTPSGFEGDIWLEHVGGSHYQFLSRAPFDVTVLVISGELKFYGYNSVSGSTTTLQKINGAFPGSPGSLGQDNSVYRFFAPLSQVQAIENAHLDGTQIKLRTIDRDTNTTTIFEVTAASINSSSAYIDLGVTNEDSSEPADNFYTTITPGVEVHVEVFNGSANTDKFPANWDTTFASGYLADGLGYQGYRPDHNVVEYLLDYLLNPNYGFGLDINELDRKSWTEAAIACDKLPEYFDFDNRIFYMDGGSSIAVKDRNEYMYGDTATTGASANGAQVHTNNNGLDRIFKIETNRTFIENINKMLASIGAYLYFNEGKIRIVLENAGDPLDNNLVPPETALPIVMTITDDNIIESAGVSTSAINDRFNQIKLDYTDLVNNSQPNSALSPDPIEDSTNVRTQYLAEDNNKVLEGNFSFPGVFDRVTAQKVATLLLKKSRQQPTFVTQINAVGVRLAPGDFVRVNSTALAINDIYRITETAYNSDNTVNITAIKHVPEFYDVTDTGQIFEQQRPLIT
tara:strand:+ start:297 stop:3020 length:2724 start_codon:yes stop_codon:yes gene_type:complete